MSAYSFESGSLAIVKDILTVTSRFRLFLRFLFLLPLTRITPKAQAGSDKRGSSVRASLCVRLLYSCAATFTCHALRTALTVVPLHQGVKLAVIGLLIVQAALQGVGALHLTPWLVTTAELTLRRSGGGSGSPAGTLLLGVPVRSETEDAVLGLGGADPSTRMYRSLPMKSDVLRRVRKLPIPMSSKGFFLRFRTGILPTKARQEERGLFLPGRDN